MKSIKLFATFFVVLTVFTISFPSGVFALTPGRTELIEARCERITTRVDSILANYETRKERYIERHDKLAARVKELLEKLEAKEYDTTEIREILDSLKSKRAELITEHKAFVQDLHDSKTYACGASEGKFKEEIQSSREHLSNVRTLSKEIRTEVKEVLIPALKELKDSKTVESN